MSYIPGFSKYAQNNIPRYALGGRVAPESGMYDVDRYESFDIGDSYDGGYTEPAQSSLTQAAPMEAAPVSYAQPSYNPYMREEPLYGSNMRVPAQQTPTYQAPTAQPAYNPYMSEQPSLGSNMIAPPPQPAYNPYMSEQPSYGSTMQVPQQTAQDPMRSAEYTTSAQPTTDYGDTGGLGYAMPDLGALDFSGLNNLYGMNFGSDFGGGAMGGIYPDNPNLQYIGAPVSNKGNATGRSAGNTFTMTPEQPVRLVDLRTNTVVFEGTGYDAARKATELGQNMTDTLGRKASYDIQTANPEGVYSTVANEKKNKSTLGTIASAVGTALPLATMFIPGLNVLGTIAVGAGLGGAGAGLRGKNILKGAAMGGLSAAGGAVLGPALEAGGRFGTSLAPQLARAVGTGIGTTTGGLATGQSLKNSLLSGVASGALSYVAPSITDKLGLSGATSGTGGSSGMTADGGLQVTGSTLGSTGGLSFGGSSPSAVKDPYDGINVTGAKLSNLSGINFDSSLYGAPVEGPSAFEQMYQPQDDIVVDGRRPPTPAIAGLDTPLVAPTQGALTPEILRAIEGPVQDDIVVNGTRVQPTNVSVGDGGLSPEILRAIERPVQDDIVVDGRRPPTELLAALGGAGALAAATTGGVGAGAGAVNGVDPALDEIVVSGSVPGAEIPAAAIAGLGAIPAITQGALTPAQTSSTPPKDGLGLDDISKYLRLAGLASGLAGGLTSKGGSDFRIPAGAGSFSSVFNRQLPTANLPGVAGGTAGPRSPSSLAARGLSSPSDYYRYGYGPEQSFFNDVPQGAANTSTAYTGYERGGQRSPQAEQQMTQQLTSILGSEEAAVRALQTMSEDEIRRLLQDTPARFAEGGFAVQGAGDGRDDEISALLSDGEYVIDAETVALLGNGSNKAGAEALDSFRVNIRKQKGRDLARGDFSAKAKRPEQYLVGGRS